MYRSPDARPTTPPTRIEFHSKLVRYRVYPIGLVLFLAALAMFASIQATHLTCEPAGVLPGHCIVTRYALPTLFQSVDVRATDVLGVDVKIRTGSKGGRYAVAHLLTSQGSVDLAGGLWGRFDPESALNGQARFVAYKKAPSTGLDVWFSQTDATSIMMFLAGILLGAFAFAMMREQIIQHRPIVVVVDHDRALVQIGRREVRIDEIDDVRVDTGRALFWSSGKNEHIPGFRLVVTTRSGQSVPATRDYRAGNHAVHERARARLLAAIGRAT